MGMADIFKYTRVAHNGDANTEDSTAIKKKGMWEVSNGQPQQGKKVFRM